MLLSISTESHRALSKSCPHASGRMFMYSSPETVRASRDWYFPALYWEVAFNLSLCEGIFPNITDLGLRYWSPAQFLGMKDKANSTPVLPFFEDNLLGSLSGTCSSWMLTLCVYISPSDDGYQVMPLYPPEALRQCLEYSIFYIAHIKQIMCFRVAI